jgi:hypothetical protein
MYSIYNNINLNNLNNFNNFNDSSFRYNRDHIYTDDDFERIRLSGNTVKINNTIFANGSSCLGVTQLKPNEYQQYLLYLQKINIQSEKNIKEPKEKKVKETKEKKVKEPKEKKVKEPKEKTKNNDILQLNNKKIKLDDVKKLIKIGATVHISV